MKKEYVAPKAEKVVFDYTESVVACRSEEIQNAADSYNNNPNGQYFKCTCQTETKNYAPGWGRNC